MFYRFDQFPGEYQIIHSVFKAEQLQWEDIWSNKSLLSVMKCHSSDETYWKSELFV